MRYDPQSAFIFTRTDWPSLGAVHSPPPDVPRFGMPLTVWETEALGRSRRAAENSRLGSATEPFAQPHPQHAERGIILLCTAWCHREGGWTIGLVDPTGQDSPWVLKADIEAQLHCACHCDWRAECPGVVSSGAGHPPGTDARLRAPVAQPQAPQSVQQRERRGWFGQRKQTVAEPTTVMAPAAAVPDYAALDDWRQPAEEYRGSIHAPDPARHADDVLYIDAPEPEPEAVSIARAQPRGFWGGWLARREEPAQALEAPPPPALDENPYLSREGNGPALFSNPQDYAHHPVDYEPSAPQLSAPADEPLSTQSEIDSFVEAAHAYAEQPAPEPAYEPAPVSYDGPLALPAPEGQTNG